MTDRLTALQVRMEHLRTDTAAAATGGDRAAAARNLAELAAAEREWRAAIEALLPAALIGRGSGTSVRERVERTLALLGAPAGPTLLHRVHAAVFASAAGEKTENLAALRRDEQRSFRSNPHARTYVCAVLTRELTPARGLFALSSWPLEQRVRGPRSARVDELMRLCALAGHLKQQSEAGCVVAPEAVGLVAELARTLPGAARPWRAENIGEIAALARQAAAPLREADRADRAAIAKPARGCPDEVQLFGLQGGREVR